MSLLNVKEGHDGVFDSIYKHLPPFYLRVIDTAG